MKYIIGIGNPGREYEETRHNIGFQVVDKCFEVFQKNRSMPVVWQYKRSLRAWVAEFGEVSLIKPKTFVNLTGQTLEAIAAKEKMDLGNLLIICDDVNLEFGKLRLRSKGSAGGHHGLESIIGVLDSEEFARLRIGIGASQMPKDLTSFVLGKFDADEAKGMDSLLKRVALICGAWVKEDFESAVNHLSKLQSNSPKFL